MLKLDEGNYVFDNPNTECSIVPVLYLRTKQYQQYSTYSPSDKIDRG